MAHLKLSCPLLYFCNCVRYCSCFSQSVFVLNKGIVYHFSIFPFLDTVVSNLECVILSGYLLYFMYYYSHFYSPKKVKRE